MFHQASFRGVLPQRHVLGLAGRGKQSPLMGRGGGEWLGHEAGWNTSPTNYGLPVAQGPDQMPSEQLSLAPGPVEEAISSIRYGTGRVGLEVQSPPVQRGPFMVGPFARVLARRLGRSGLCPPLLRPIPTCDRIHRGMAYLTAATDRCPALAASRPSPTPRHPLAPLYPLPTPMHGLSGYCFASRSQHVVGHRGGTWCGVPDPKPQTPHPVQTESQIAQPKLGADETGEHSTQTRETYQARRSDRHSLRVCHMPAAVYCAPQFSESTWAKKRQMLVEGMPTTRRCVLRGSGYVSPAQHMCFSTSTECAEYTAAVCCGARTVENSSRVLQIRPDVLSMRERQMYIACTADTCCSARGTCRAGKCRDSRRQQIPGESVPNTRQMCAVV